MFESHLLTMCATTNPKLGLVEALIIIFSNIFLQKPSTFSLQKCDDYVNNKALFSKHEEHIPVFNNFEVIPIFKKSASTTIRFSYTVHFCFLQMAIAWCTLPVESCFISWCPVHSGSTLT